MLDEKQLEELKDRLENTFSDYYEEAGGWEYRYHHLLRARRYAVKLMEKVEFEEDVDPVVVELAALFHDIGRKQDIEDGYLNPMEKHEGHDETGAEIVAEYLEDIVSGEQLRRIEKVIRNHHSKPETVEGRIVQDADDLGKFGPTDLWRLIHYASGNERTLDETIEYFHEKLMPENQELVQDLHLERSKEVARERLQEYQGTMNRIEKEVLGEDI